MDGEQDGTQTQQQEKGREDRQPAQDDEKGLQESLQQQVSAAEPKPEDYEAQLRAKDARIAELSAKVAEAAKSAEAAESLSEQITELKRQMEDERIEFALKAAGCRSTKAARALLADHDGDVAKLKEAEPWLFAGDDAKGGTTGLEPAGASGGSAEKDRIKHWRELAGLSEDDGEE